jgi:Arc/MetJ-type ribon-helix-helix transcriptional regulator
MLDTRFLRSYAWCMEFQLTPDQEAFVRQAIASGLLRREEDAVKEALSLSEERERTLAEFRATVEESEASLARGEGRAITEESLQQLAGGAAFEFSGANRQF